MANDGKQKTRQYQRSQREPTAAGTIRYGFDSDARARQDGSQQPIVAIPVLTPDRPTKRQNGRRMKGEGEARFTLTSADRHGVMLYSDRATDSDHSSTLKARNDSGRGRTQCQTGVVEQSRIRRLTPTECARLQGFPDSWADLGLFQNKQGEWHVREISDTGKYQVFGNAVTTNVIEAIIGRMLEVGCLE
jgi:DNA (cytosine-5)-methyltransferase 1